MVKYVFIQSSVFTPRNIVSTLIPILRKSVIVSWRGINELIQLFPGGNYLFALLDDCGKSLGNISPMFSDLFYHLLPLLNILVGRVFLYVIKDICFCFLQHEYCLIQTYFCDFQLLPFFIKHRRLHPSIDKVIYISLSEILLAVVFSVIFESILGHVHCRSKAEGCT